jgi:hypothetical protein
MPVRLHAPSVLAGRWVGGAAEGKDSACSRRLRGEGTGECVEREVGEELTFVRDSTTSRLGWAVVSAAGTQCSGQAVSPSLVLLHSLDALYNRLNSVLARSSCWLPLFWRCVVCCPPPDLSNVPTVNCTFGLAGRPPVAKLGLYHLHPLQTTGTRLPSTSPNSTVVIAASHFCMGCGRCLVRPTPPPSVSRGAECVFLGWVVFVEISGCNPLDLEVGVGWLPPPPCHLFGWRGGETPPRRRLR